jgi:cbb3-type cytochrome oxidase subunit 3
MKHKTKARLFYVGFTLAIILGYFATIILDNLNLIPRKFGGLLFFIYFIILFSGIIYFSYRSVKRKNNLDKYDIKNMKLKWNEKNFYVYDKGLRYHNIFIEWRNIKSLKYPLSFKASKFAGSVGSSVSYNPLYRSASEGDTLRLMDGEENVYIIELKDKISFERALNKVGKLTLIK